MSNDIERLPLEFRAMIAREILDHRRLSSNAVQQYEEALKRHLDRYLRRLSHARTRVHPDSAGAAAIDDVQDLLEEMYRAEISRMSGAKRVEFKEEVT